MGAEVTLEADEQALLQLSSLLESSAAELRTFFDRIAEAVASYAEKVHDTEVRNVAAIG
jgi:hypothetical protein